MNDEPDKAQSNPASDGGNAVGVDRRSFLRGMGAGAVGGAMSAGVPLALGAGAEASVQTPGQAGRMAPVPFHGRHQAGILTPAQPAATFAVFDCTATTKEELTRLMRSITAVARTITAGGAMADPGIGAPPTDNAVLGPEADADGLTFTVGVGASLFDHRYGLNAAKPKRLTPMPVFPNDNLDPATTHGDLLIQICAGNRDAVLRALRLIAKQTRGWMQLRYRLDGFSSPPTPTGAQRNLLGFKDGISNPDAASPGVGSELIWAASDEPDWALGGTYQVLRIIRMFVEFWDRVSLNEQENMIGRRRDSGAPLDGGTETDIPRYARDPQGKVIPLDAHIRLANPRTPGTASQRMLRRGYNYDQGIDVNGNLNMGLIFNAFQQNPQRQFEATQDRLIDEPLVDYISPTGGGYFFCLPGVRDNTDWYARALLT